MGAKWREKRKRREGRGLKRKVKRERRRVWVREKKGSEVERRETEEKVGEAKEKYR